MTLGTMLVWPSVSAAIANLGESEPSGLLQGLALAAAGGGRIFGPLAGGLLYDRSGIHGLLGVLMWSLLVPAGAFALIVRRLQPSVAEEV